MTSPKMILVALTSLVFYASLSNADERPFSEITLVRDSEPVASIVVARNPTPAARLAALELQYHIRKITGAVVPIKTDREEVAGPRILVGESEQTRLLGTDVDSLEAQEYLIRFLPDTLVLLGRDWQPTEENRQELGRDTYGGTLESTRHEIDYREATGQTDQEAELLALPGFFDEQGTCHATYHFLEQFCGVRWYGPTELNIVFPARETLAVRGAEIRRSRDLKQVHALGGSWPIVKAQWNNPSGAELNLFWRRMRVGGEKWAGNHTIWRKTVAEVFTDPEYQAEGRGKGSQLCYSNPQLVKKVAQVARDYFEGKELSDGIKAMGDYFAVVPDDNASWCRCEKCREAIRASAEDTRGEGFFSNARTSRYVFNFVNEVAKEVGRTHPDKYIAALAYASYAYPPKDLKLEPNVSVAPCLHTCYGYEQKTYENDMAMYRAWMEDGDRPIYLWNYFHHPMEPALIHKWNCFPCFMPDVISREVNRYHRDGIRGVFLCGIGQQLDYYLYMQTAFDADTDYEELVDEFFDLYFGNASEPMRKFHDRISEINGEEGIVAIRPEQAWRTLGTPERMKELERHIEQAENLAKTETEKERVETWKKGVWEWMDAGHRQFYDREQQ